MHASFFVRSFGIAALVIICVAVALADDSKKAPKKALAKKLPAQVPVKKGGIKTDDNTAAGGEANNKLTKELNALKLEADEPDKKLPPAGGPVPPKKDGSPPKMSAEEMEVAANVGWADCKKVDFATVSKEDMKKPDKKKIDALVECLITKNAKLKGKKKSLGPYAKSRLFKEALAAADGAADKPAPSNPDPQSKDKDKIKKEPPNAGGEMPKEDDKSNSANPDPAGEPDAVDKVPMPDESINEQKPDSSKEPEPKR